MWAVFVLKSSNNLFQPQHAIAFHKYLDNEAREFFKFINTLICNFSML